MTAYAKRRESYVNGRSLNLISVHTDISLVISMIPAGNRLWTPRKGRPLVFPNDGYASSSWN